MISPKIRFDGVNMCKSGFDKRRRAIDNHGGTESTEGHGVGCRILRFLDHPSPFAVLRSFPRLKKEGTKGW